MHNKKKIRLGGEPNKPPRYTAFLESEKEDFIEKLSKKYPSLPHPLLEMIVKVYEKQTYGTDAEKEVVQQILDQMPKRPDLTYFGSNGFQETIEENKGFKININSNNI